IDTLDYTGDGLNAGSKVTFAAVCKKKRELWREIPSNLNLARPFNQANMPFLGVIVVDVEPFTTYANEGDANDVWFIELEREVWREIPSNLNLARPFNQAKMPFPGVIVVDGKPFTTYADEGDAIDTWCKEVEREDWSGIRLIVLVDDAAFAADNVNNFAWVTFTRSNPAYDIYGVDSFTLFKHWGCRGPVIIDARRKAHHAPDLIKDEAVERKVDRLGAKGGSLHGII